MTSILLLVAAARALEPAPAINAQLYHVSIDGRTGLSLDDAIVAPEGQWTARGVLQYVNDPLVFVLEDGTELGGLEDVVGLNLVGGWTWRALRLGVDLPIYPWAGGDAVDAGALVGDMSLDARTTVLDPARAVVGIAPTLRVALPTAGARAPLGARGFDASLGVAASQRWGAWSAAANLALHLSPAVDDLSVAWGNRLDVRLGGARALTQRAGVTSELSLAPVFAAVGEGPAVPTEILVGGWAGVSQDLVVRGSVGTGLSRAVGTPDARVILAVGWEPSLVHDRDKDGLLDPVDACVSAAEDVDGFKDGDGCPEADNDDDGIVDAADRCALLPEDKDGFEDDNGCPDDDNDSDGILDDQDLCRDVAEDRDGWMDEDGCVDATTRVDVVVTSSDGRDLPDAKLELGTTRLAAVRSVEVAPGTVTFRARALDHADAETNVFVVDGPPVRIDLVLKAVPPSPPSKAEPVVVTREKITFYDTIRFDTNKATIKKASFALLDSIAAAMVAHPELTRVRVEGHTDDVGDDVKNLKLSQARAESVRAYLVKQGVAEGRLVAMGLGETRPLVASKKPADRERNRRVELVIEARD